MGGRRQTSLFPNVSFVDSHTSIIILISLVSCTHAWLLNGRNSVAALGHAESTRRTGKSGGR